MALRITLSRGAGTPNGLAALPPTHDGGAVTSLTPANAYFRVSDDWGAKATTGDTLVTPGCTVPVSLPDDGRSRVLSAVSADGDPLEISVSEF